MSSSQPVHLPQPLSLDSVGWDALMQVLTAGCSAADLARLECASKDFGRLTEDAARAIVTDPKFPKHKLDVDRLSASWRWLHILHRIQQLSKPLRFTKAGPGIELHGSRAVLTSSAEEEAEFVVATEFDPKPATAICGDYVMRHGVHNVAFTVNPHTCDEYMGIGLVRADWNPNSGGHASCSRHGLSWLGPIEGVEGDNSGAFRHNGKELSLLHDPDTMENVIYEPGDTVGFELDLENHPYCLTVYLQSVTNPYSRFNNDDTRKIVGKIDDLERFFGKHCGDWGLCWMAELTYSQYWWGPEESVSIAMAPLTEEMEQGEVNVLY